MPRGNVPRQPSRSGRQEGARRATVLPLKSTRSLKGAKDAKKAAPRPIASRVSLRAGKAPKSAVLKKQPVLRTKDAASRVSTYDPLAPERVRQIIAGLDRLYPGVTCALTHRSAYPTVQDFAALEPEQLEPDIRSTGFFRNKSKSVVGAARKVVADFGGNVPQTMEELLSLPGVARKTANVVLGTWFQKNEGVVVDTHVTRISRRLELTRHEDPKKIEEDLMRIIPRERWTDFSHEVIWHGRKLCVARGPKCADCALEKLCHAADKTWSTVEIHADARP